MKQANRGSQPSVHDTAPGAVAEYRQLLSWDENVVDPQTWAGSVPAAQGIAPRVRMGRSQSRQQTRGISGQDQQERS